MNPMNFTLRRSAFAPANAVFIIDCLSERDLQTGRSRLDELHDLLFALEPKRFEYNRNFVHRFKVGSAAEFAGCFEEIKGACALGIYPIIFIDAHGHPTEGLEMPSSEFVSWDELLERFAGVVNLTAGELTAVVAACHSMKAVENLRLPGRLPFAFYYGYSSEVKAGVVATETEMIYQSIFNDGGLSVLNLTNLQLKSFSEYDHIESLLAVVLLMSRAPVVLAKALPELSRNKLRAGLDKEAAKRGIPLSGSREKVNTMLNSGQIAIEVVKQSMHDTPRRQKVIEDIQAYLQSTS